jgi:hypothetical protein
MKKLVFFKSKEDNENRGKAIFRKKVKEKAKKKIEAGEADDTADAKRQATSEEAEKFMCGKKHMKGEKCMCGVRKSEDPSIVFLKGGKAAAAGETRTWGGKDYIKLSTGGWKPKGEGKQPAKDDDPKKKPGKKPDENGEKKPKLSPEKQKILNEVIKKKLQSLGRTAADTATDIAAGDTESVEGRAQQAGGAIKDVAETGKKVGEQQAKEDAGKEGSDEDLKYQREELKNHDDEAVVDSAIKMSETVKEQYYDLEGDTYVQHKKDLIADGLDEDEAIEEAQDYSAYTAKKDIAKKLKSGEIKLKDKEINRMLYELEKKPKKKKPLKKSFVFKKETERKLIFKSASKSFDEKKFNAAIKNYKDKMPGGAGDRKTPGDYNQDSLRAGVKVELEHTKDHQHAMEIAIDHLAEDKNYYTKLKKIHKD